MASLEVGVREGSSPRGVGQPSGKDGVGHVRPGSPNLLLLLHSSDPSGIGTPLTQIVPSPGETGCKHGDLIAMDLLRPSPALPAHLVLLVKSSPWAQTA